MEKRKTLALGGNSRELINFRVVLNNLNWRNSELKARGVGKKCEFQDDRNCTGNVTWVIIHRWGSRAPKAFTRAYRVSRLTVEQKRGNEKGGSSQPPGPWTYQITAEINHRIFSLRNFCHRAKVMCQIYNVAMKEKNYIQMDVISQMARYRGKFRKKSAEFPLHCRS